MKFLSFACLLISTLSLTHAHSIEESQHQRMVKRTSLNVKLSVSTALTSFISKAMKQTKCQFRLDSGGAYEGAGKAPNAHYVRTFVRWACLS